ncbi:DUF397 domain-containing protein [Nocardiopsis exhalans]|uniref:DUF397 domain-containing protein n=1 Tax=Nocardiopsis exhalans TaxID=163604 RepID=A0ABY5D7M8_9ACTN|nr:DUF397 domain-containing protein [Nocardiopsis exhalans]USY19390.1 DUF397 domain-containing protein [Nocardiopsis exhalans]
MTRQAPGSVKSKLKDQYLLTFRKSSYSATANDCVEVADTPHGSAVRDTQNREAGHLTFPGQEWVTVLFSARADQV